jgi:hypothetical protein
MTRKAPDKVNWQRQAVMVRAWALYRVAPARWFNASRFRTCLARAWAQVKAEAAAAAIPAPVRVVDVARLEALKVERYAVEMSDGNLFANNLRLAAINSELRGLAA